MTVENSGISAATRANITAAVGIFALLSALYTGISGYNAQGYEIATLKANQLETNQSVKMLNQELRQLRDIIGELNLTMREMQIRQESNNPTRR